MKFSHLAENFALELAVRASVLSSARAEIGRAETVPVAFKVISADKVWVFGSRVHRLYASEDLVVFQSVRFHQYQHFLEPKFK